VRFLHERFGVSQRRACGLIGTHRSTVRYRPRVRADAALHERLIELARERGRFGYRRLHVLLRREGLVVNHKRVLRLYQLAGLGLRRQKRKRMPSMGRGTPSLPTRPNECWALDFVSDTLAWGRRIRCLTVVDCFTRESPAIAIDTSVPGARVVRVVDDVALQRGLPQTIVMDNGPELTSRVLDQWAYEHGVELRFIDPGKPIQNASQGPPRRVGSHAATHLYCRR
jgi:putative transposase